MSPCGPSCLLKSSPNGSPQRHLSSEISFLTTRNPALGSQFDTRFAGQHHSCCHSNVYRRWDIKPKMWQIWKWLHHPMEETPQQKPDPTSVGKSDTGFVILSNDWAPGMVLLGHFPPWTSLTRQEPGWKNQVTWDVSHIHPPWFTHFYESTGFEESTFTLGVRSQHTPKICTYSLPTTKNVARKVENPYNAIKDSKVISLNQPCGSASTSSSSSSTSSR